MSQDLDKLVRSEQVRSVYGQTITIALSHPMAAALLAWVFRDVVEHSILFTWLAVTVFVLAIRVLLWVAFVRQDSGQVVAPFWAKIFIFFSMLQGSIWAYAWLTFIPVGDPIYLVVIALWVVGLNGAVINGASAYLSVIFAFCLPVIVPAMLHFFVIDSQLGTALGLALLLYMVVTMRSVFPINKWIVNAIRLNHVLQEEIIERKKVEVQLQEIAIKDGVTDLYNRRYFDEVLEVELNMAQRNASYLSMILIDVDFFKNYNDTYGHLDGDVCLQQVASKIKQEAKRSYDKAFRYGGEEFAVILANADEEVAIRIAQSIRQAVEKLKIEHRGSLLPGVNTLTISAGIITMIPTKETMSTDIIAGADGALYEAKNQGRNSVVARSK